VDGNFNDGISSRDGLVLAAGNVIVHATDDGIVGKDYAVLLDGAYQVTAGDDGFKSDNEEDEGRGWVLLNGGTLNVSAGDDGIKAFNTLTIAAGVTIVEESEEALEAQHVVMSGGTANVTSNDDGVNASGGSTGSTDTPGGMGGGMGGWNGQRRDGRGRLHRGSQRRRGIHGVTGGTAQVTAGIGEGTLDGAQEQGTVTAGEYTAGRGPGGR
jgi:hypothetical protein